MNNGDIYKTLKFAVKNPNFTKCALEGVLGSRETVNYILGNANPKERYFTRFGSTSENETWVATIEAVSLFESMKQGVINQKSLNVAFNTLLITMLLALMSIFFNLANVELSVIGSFVIISVLIFTVLLVMLSVKK